MGDDVVHVFNGPGFEGIERFAQANAKFGEGVLNVEGLRGDDVAVHEAVGFEGAECLRQYLLRYSVDTACNIRETVRSLLEYTDDEDCPPITDAVKQLA